MPIIRPSTSPYYSAGATSLSNAVTHEHAYDALVGSGLQLSDDDDATYVDLSTTGREFAVSGYDADQYWAMVDFPATAVDLPATITITMRGQALDDVDGFAWCWPYRTSDGADVLPNGFPQFFVTDTIADHIYTYSLTGGTLDTDDLTMFVDTLAAGDLSVIMVTFAAPPPYDVNKKVRWFELSIGTEAAVVGKPYVCRIHPGFHP